MMTQTERKLWNDVMTAEWRACQEAEAMEDAIADEPEEFSVEDYREQYYF